MLTLMMREAARTLRYSWQRPGMVRRATDTHTPTLTHVGKGLPEADVLHFAAKGPSGDYAIGVIAPPALPPRGGYPVLYLLDGNGCMGMAADAMALQMRFATHSRLEPLVIVTVGYPGTQSFNLGRRAYDYLPPHSSKRWRDRFMQGAPWHQPGGAEAFLDFLTGPLRADIAARYPTNPERQILCGHSFGGFFALHVLLTRPDSFQKYAALSPSLWWDDSRLMKQADSLLTALPAL